MHCPSLVEILQFGKYLTFRLKTMLSYFCTHCIISGSFFSNALVIMLITLPNNILFTSCKSFTNNRFANQILSDEKIPTCKNLIFLLFQLFADPEQLLEENRRLKEAQICKICMESEANIVFLPCGHLCCCARCAAALGNCPICRQYIRGTVKTYRS